MGRKPKKREPRPTMRHKKRKKRIGSPKKKRSSKKKQTLPWRLQRQLPKLLLPLRKSPKILRRKRQICCEIKKQRAPPQRNWSKLLLTRMQQKRCSTRRKRQLRLHGEQYLTLRKNLAKHIGKCFRQRRRLASRNRMSSMRSTQQRGLRSTQKRLKP